MFCGSLWSKSKARGGAKSKNKHPSWRYCGILEKWDLGAGTRDLGPIRGTRDAGLGIRDPSPGTQDPGSGTHTWDPGPGTFTWDPGPGTLHLGPFLKHSHSYISYMSYERLRGEEQFRSKKYLLEMTPSRAKLRLKSPPQKRNF